MLTVSPGFTLVGDTITEMDILGCGVGVGAAGAAGAVVGAGAALRNTASGYWAGTG